MGVNLDVVLRPWEPGGARAEWWARLCHRPRW